MGDLLTEFKQFLIEYRTAWNSCQSNKIMEYCSEDLQVRWSLKEKPYVSDWGYDQAASGWEQAYNMYKGRNPQWFFHDLLIDINKQNEGVAVFWVTFYLDGEELDIKTLFTETFKKEDGKWKKIREYVENGFRND